MHLEIGPGVPACNPNTRGWGKWSGLKVIPLHLEFKNSLDYWRETERGTWCKDLKEMWTILLIFFLYWLYGEWIMLWLNILIHSAHSLPHSTTWYSDSFYSFLFCLSKILLLGNLKLHRVSICFFWTGWSRLLGGHLLHSFNVITPGAFHHSCLFSGPLVGKQ